MVTAEVAVAIPAVVLVLALALAGVAAAVDSVRCVDAARVGARAAARGDDGAAAAAAVAPSGSAVRVDRAGGDVAVTVVAPARPLAGWVGGSPQARSVAAVEDAQGEP